MKRLLALALFWPLSAYATQSSLICKTVDTNETIDIISKGPNTNDVLVEINSGPYYDGQSMMLNNMLVVTVNFTTGGLIITNDSRNKGSLMISVGNDHQNHNLVCKYRS